MAVISQNAIKHGFLSRLAGIGGEFRAPGNLFMQNKAKLPDAQMNVKSFQTTDYDDFAALRLRKNKAKTNPISKSHKCTKAAERTKGITGAVEKAD